LNTATNIEAKLEKSAETAAIAVPIDVVVVLGSRCRSQDLDDARHPRFCPFRPRDQSLNEEKRFEPEVDAVAKNTDEDGNCDWKRPRAARRS
jgi:hypothetical protein